MTAPAATTSAHVVPDAATGTSSEAASGAETTGTVLAVCIVDQLHHVPGIVGRTAIDKVPVEGPVGVRAVGLYADVQADREHHGGIFKAVYAFSQAEADFWAGELGRDVPPGAFGENLRVDGDVVDAALIGERWRVGQTLEVEVTGPRRPCRVFAHWVERPGMVKDYTRRGRPGVYLRVVTPGEVAAGDRVVVTHRPAHGVRVAQFFTAPTPEGSAAVLASEEAGELTLSPKERARHTTVAARGSIDLTPGA